VSKQLHYIVSAFLLIIFFSGLFLFVNKISFDHSSPIAEFSYQETYMEEAPVSDAALRGKAIFNARCASCHGIFKDQTGPALTNLEDRHKWADRNELYRWIKNPAAYMKNDAYTQQLKKQYGSMMTAFPDMANEEIDAIVEYIRSARLQQSIPMPLASR
jgi:cytochrome c2